MEGNAGPSAGFRILDVSTGLSSSKTSGGTSLPCPSSWSHEPRGQGQRVAASNGLGVVLLRAVDVDRHVHAFCDVMAVGAPKNAKRRVWWAPGRAFSVSEVRCQRPFRWRLGRERRLADVLRRQLAAVGQQVCMSEGRPPACSGVAGPTRRAGVPRKREDGRGELHAEGSTPLATSEEVLARADRHHERDAWPP